MFAVAAILVLLLAVGQLRAEALERRQLSSGFQIPTVGLGTSTIKPEEMEQAILSALDNGYRHIDTAFVYGNEAQIGTILKKWFSKGGKREDLFITSKLPPQANNPRSVEKYLTRSLKDLGLDYVDMYLIHMPFAFKEGDNYDTQKVNGNEVVQYSDHNLLWKAMEDQVRKGRAKSIGVSNFNYSQLLNVYNNARIKPSNLQVESHIYLQQPELRKFCKEHNIVMTAYAPLGSQGTRHQLYQGTPKDLPPLVEIDLVKKLAKKYNKTPSQILLRHAVQDGLVVIPKSANSQRQKTNLSIFDFKLTDDEMRSLYSLDAGETGRVFDFAVFYPGLEKTPQYPFGKTKQ